MKILIVSFSDIKGGAARSAYRLHKGLQKIGINTKMLVQNKYSDDISVFGPDSNFEKGLNIFKPKLDAWKVNFYRKRKGTLFSPSIFPSKKIIKKINESDADIVHLHWIAGGMINVRLLDKIRKPIVWSLLDMWAFTGGCHYDENCERYTTFCHSCPVLGSQRKKDLSYRGFKGKQKTYKSIPLTIVGHSKWLTDCAAKSSLLQDKKVLNIASPIDTELFKPINKETAREILGLSQHKKIVMFGAMQATTNKRKGFNELSQALTKINLPDIEMIVLGSSKPQNEPDLKFPIRYMGKYHDDISLQILYSAADVMIVPSLQENLSNMILESLSCGTPVVAFNIGGNPDMIEHKKCGYLVRPYDTDDMARGIEWVANNLQKYKLSNNARKKILSEFSDDVVPKQYVSLYKDILNN